MFCTTDLTIKCGLLSLHKPCTFKVDIPTQKKMELNYIYQSTIQQSGLPSILPIPLEPLHYSLGFNNDRK